MLPTIGQIVHYKTRSLIQGHELLQNVGAMIVDVKKHALTGNVKVKLCVFNPTGIYFSGWSAQGNDPDQWQYITDDVPSGELDKCIRSNDTMDILHKPDPRPYIIASGDTMDELEVEVGELIDVGYIPSGAPQLSRSDSDDNARHYQAMCLLSIYQN